MLRACLRDNLFQPLYVTEKSALSGWFVHQLRRDTNTLRPCLQMGNDPGVDRDGRSAHTPILAWVYHHSRGWGARVLAHFQPQKITLRADAFCASLESTILGHGFPLSQNINIFRSYFVISPLDCERGVKTPYSFFWSSFFYGGASHLYWCFSFHQRLISKYVISHLFTDLSMPITAYPLFSWSLRFKCCRYHSRFAQALLSSLRNSYFLFFLI